MPEDAAPEELSEEVIYDGRIVHLKRVELRLKDGAVVKREVVVHNGSVGILPITASGDFIFVRQFRLPAGRALLELPAGTLEQGENPTECAQRELAEEIGQHAGTMRRMAGFYLAPGWATEFMHAFIAEELSPRFAKADDDEDIELVTLTLEQAVEAIRNGEIVDCKSVALIGLYLMERLTTSQQDAGG